MCASTYIPKLAGVILAAIFVLGAGGAQAQPQSLALVATNGSVELTCDDTRCSAEFSSFCLQADRYSPVRGTKYELAGGGDVRLIGTTMAGRRVSLDPRQVLKFESLRRHLATRVSISRSQVAALGLRTVTVEVRENASLVPLPGQGVGLGMNDFDKEILTGSLRLLGTMIVDADPTRMAAARIANRMINALPRTGRLGAEAGHALWRQVVAETTDDNITRLGRKYARNAFELCDYLVNGVGADTLRQCLQRKHDTLINELNADYWQAVKTGS